MYFEYGSTCGSGETYKNNTCTTHPPIVGHTPHKDLQFTVGFGKIYVLSNAFESLVRKKGNLI